jgi:hypothetical protein
VKIIKDDMTENQQVLLKPTLVVRQSTGINLKLPR